MRQTSNFLAFNLCALGIVFGRLQLFAPDTPQVFNLRHLARVWINGSPGELVHGEKSTTRG